MSPKSDNRNLSEKLDVTVDIPHEQGQTPLVPTEAPPFPGLEPLPIRPIKITDNVPVPPPATPVVPTVTPHELHVQEGRRWPVVLMYVVLAFLVSALVVFAGRWVYEKTTHKTTKTAKPESADTSKLPAVPPAGNQQPATTSNPTAGAGQNKAASQLPNNGPGDVVAIFVSTALAVGGLHYIYNLRRQN